MDRQQRRARRRDGLEHDFRRLEDRRAILHGKLERAKSMHAAAKAALEAAERALERASELYAGAEQDCTELQHLMVFDPDTVNGLPVELLDAVFATMNSEPDPLWPDIENVEYNESRALLPYRLGAVCQHWRRVALANSALWTYVALPSCSMGYTMEKESILPAHVSLRLERSRSLAIDVYLNFHIFVDRHEILTACWRVILSLVIDHAWRWRRVTIRLPRPHLRFEQLMARKAAPLLEELHLHVHMLPDSVIDVSWISRSPSLRKLCLPNIRFDLATTTSTVVSATLFGVFNALRNMPHLESLSLIFNELPSREEIFQRALALAFVASQLTRLVIDSGRGAASSIQDFMLAFPSITDLEIGSTSDVDLVPFSRIKRLTLTGFEVQNHLFVLTGEYDGTPSAQLRVCPALESLTIRRAPTYLDLHALTSFVCVRAAACHARGVQLRVSFESWPSEQKPPSWFRHLVAGALGPSNVRLTFSDGTVCDAVGESDEEDAEFTDPDQSFTASESDDEPEDYDPDGAAQVMRVNGSDWETDSDDMDYVDGDD